MGISTRGRTRGFTLVEALVIVGLLAALVGLLWPAIQRAREAANRMTCSSNLHAIGMAISKFTEGNRPYPMAGSAEPEMGRSWAFHFVPTAAEIPTTRELQNWGWAYQILPNLGYEQVWMKTEALLPGADPTQTEEIVVPQLQCPSRSRNRRVHRIFDNTAVAVSDYAGNAGPFSAVDPNTGRPFYDRTRRYPPPLVAATQPQYGLILANRSWIYKRAVVNPPLRPSDVLDSLSYTILVAEKRLNASLVLAGGVGAPFPGDRYGYCSGFSTDTVRSGAYAVARDETDPAVPVFDGFGSAHTNSCNALFADGSVRPLSYGMEQRPMQGPGGVSWTLLQRLCHRADHLSSEALD